MILNQLSKKTYLFLSGLLILTGIFLSPGFPEALRSADNQLSESLRIGGLLFKAGLIFSGLWIVLLERIKGYFSNQDRESLKVQLGRNTILALSLLMIVTTITRLFALNNGLWLDEIITYVNYATKSYLVIITSFESENQHFLYSLLAHTSFLIFGESSWALRLPAALFGIGSILALFFFGLEVTSKQEAFFSAALLSLSYHHIWFSQNARGYSGLLFWTIISSIYLLRAYRHNRLRDWVYFGITASLGTYTHLTMGFVILGQFVTVGLAELLRSKTLELKKYVGIFVGFGTVVIVSFLFYSLVLPQVFNTIGGTEQSVVTAWKNPLWTLFELLRGLRVGFENGLIAVLVLVIAGTGLYSYLKRQPMFVSITIIPPLVGAAITVLVGHHLWPRFFFFAFGFGALIVIRGVMAIGEWIARVNLVPGKIGTSFGQLGCVSLIFVSTLSIPFAYGPKQDYLGALDFVQENRSVNDAVATVSLASFIYSHLYQTDWIPVTSVEELDTLEGTAGPVWLIYTFPPVLESVYPNLMNSIKSDFSVIKVFKGTVENGDIIVCRSKRVNSATHFLDLGQ